MDALVTDVLFYITAALCTFLAILVSYHWLLRKPEKAQEEEKEETVNESMEQEDEEETAEDEKPEAPLVCPFGFSAPPSADKKQDDQPDRNLEGIGNLLIDSADIQPLNEEEKQKLKEDSTGALPPDSPKSVDRRKVKELEEEVIKSLSEQQLEEERRVRQAQLEAIFSLMQDNKERFGMSSVDDVQNQYKLYV
ncbi:matrix-remodeling-associated protein 7-like [Acanthaster planci]|uniref:Matrix-remodeling-associated protein 7-like n=1 Tax=Acanthaster planci TaxID=133434 RepID=A0A8B7YIB4_ACAPL|nr:matrix-remodeling-associated protein 7-like [Acanthaster planci]XP_022092353.1 matrix-remodeling-associated protein 7-like [Acanthaster planci]